MTIQLEVYSRDNPQERLDVIPFRNDVKFLEENNDVGGGSFSLSNEDDRAKDLTLLQERNIVKARLNGVIESAFIIQKRNPTVVGPGEYSATRTTIAGNGLLDWLRDAGVRPYGGVRLAAYDNRSFNFAAETGTWYNPSDWTTPAIISKWGEQPTNPWRYAPAEWPDAPDANWIWSTALPSPPLGLNFFRYEFSTSSFGRYSFFCAADDIYEVYVDGQLVTNASPGVENWSQTERIDFDLEAGAHVIGVKVNNTEGRGGFIGAFFRAGDPSVQEAAQLISVTNNVNWKVCGYPTEQPGWTPGEVLITLIDEARDRGVWFPNFITLGFDEDYDSKGQPWTRAVDWSFKVGESYLDVVKKLNELACDVWIDPDDYTLHAAAQRGSDLSVLGTDTEPVILRKAYNLTQANEKYESDIKNSLVINSNSGMLTKEDQTSIDKYGVIEDVLDISADATLSDTIAAKVLEESSSSSEGATYKIVPREGAVPFQDFKVGDWILAPGSSGDRTKRRVSSISIEEDKENALIEYSLEFDTVFRTRQMNLERWMTNTLSGSMGGTVVSAGATTTTNTPSTGPSSGGMLKRVPTQASFSSVTSEGLGYWDSGGNPKASMVFNWNPVVTYTDGSSATIPRYEVWMYKFGQSATTSTMLGFSTGNTTTITGFDSGTQYVFTLYAVSSDGVYSAVSSTETRTAAYPAQQLLAPSTPVLSSALGTITIKWDGLLGGSNPPAQFSAVQVRYSTSENGTYLVLGTTIGRGGGTSVITSLTVGETYYVKLYAIDQLGSFSEASASANIEVSGVDLTELDDMVVDLINTAQETADGKNKIFVAPLSSPPVAEQPGDLWYVQGVGPDEDKIDSIRIFNGSGWNLYQIVADSVLVPSSVGNILLSDGAVSTEKLQAKSVTSNEIDFGSAAGEALFIGGRPVQGEAQQRVPATLTDVGYWSLVKSGDIVLHPTVSWSSGVIPTSSGITIPTTGVQGALTPILEVPDSRRIYISYATTSTNMSSVVWLNASKGTISTEVITASGVNLEAPALAKYYYVILRNPTNDVSYTFEEVSKNYFTNPSFETNTNNVNFLAYTLDESQKYVGAKSLKVNATNTARNGLNLTASTYIPAEPRTVYILSQYVRPSAAGVTFEPELVLYSGSSQLGVSTRAAVSLTSGTWTRVSHIIAPWNNNVTHLRVIDFVTMPNTSTSLWVDGVMLTTIGYDELTLSATNLNPNPSAETNLNNATGHSATLTRSNAWASEGTWSFQLASPSGGDSYLKVGSGTLENGMTAQKTYRIRGTVRLTAPITMVSSRALRIAFFASIASGVYQSVTSEAAPNVAGSYDLDLVVTVPRNALECFVRYYHGGTSGTVWWDNLRIQEVTNFPLPTYFDGDNVPAGADYITEWDGTPNNSSSTLSLRHTSVAPASGGTLSSYTVFEAIGEAAEERVEVIPTGVTAYGAGGRTEMTHKGLEVYSASNQALLRLGHDIATGMEIYNETTGTMVPLSSFVFGGTIFESLTSFNLTPSSGTAWSAWQFFPIQDSTVTTPTGKFAMFVEVTAAPPPGSTQNWVVVATIDVMAGDSIVASTSPVYGISAGPSGASNYIQPGFIFTSVTVGADQPYTLRFNARTRYAYSPYVGTPSVSSYRVMCWPV